MNDWVAAVESQINANKALRRLLEKGADDVCHLERFDVHLKTTTDNFDGFKELVTKIDKRADVLRYRSQQELYKFHQTITNLKSQIRDLELLIEAQNDENSKLEFELKENAEKLRKKQP